MVYAVFIINKSGGLIFQRDFGGEAARLDTNETLRLASIWHSLHAISAQLSPVPGCLGIEVLQADTFDLHCFQLFRGKRLSASVRRLRRPQAPTGTKFFVTAAPRTIGGAALLRVIYELFTDYALKNPFYEVEMPVRCELFDEKLAAAIKGAAI